MQRVEGKAFQSRLKPDLLSKLKLYQLQYGQLFIHDSTSIKLHNSLKKISALIWHYSYRTVKGCDMSSDHCIALY